MQRAFFGRGARDAAHAQVEHKTRIVRGKASEFGGGHIVFAKEFFDFADQHLWVLPGVVMVGHRANPIPRIARCSYNVPVEFLLV